VASCRLLSVNVGEPLDPPADGYVLLCCAQRQGFRMRFVERDAFTVASGYAPRTMIDGIELRDRVWLDLRLDGATRPPV
jgi:hypothetical protein